MLNYKDFWDGEYWTIINTGETSDPNVLIVELQNKHRSIHKGIDGLRPVKKQVLINRSIIQVEHTKLGVDY